MTVNIEHLKRVLLAKGYTHDTLLDLWISPSNEWFHLCNDGMLLRVANNPHCEYDPRPTPAESLSQ